MAFNDFYRFKSPETTVDPFFVKMVKIQKLSPDQSKLMPSLEFGNQIIECSQGENLRRVLMKAKAPLYNGISLAIHCRGMGTCGTCAVHVEGKVSEMTRIERWRLDFPPHQAGSGLRLACQCRVLGDLRIVKYPGMWGQKTARPS